MREKGGGGETHSLFQHQKYKGKGYIPRYQVLMKEKNNLLLSSEE
jgi:hypothetical protein